LNENGDLRGVLNSSHNRDGAFVVRTVGDDHEPRKFSTWCAKAITCIGKLPPTLADRAIEVRLVRKLPGESAERFSQQKPAIKGLCGTLARRAARWAADHVMTLQAADPAIPAGLHNRAADNWLPLLAVADAIGGHWPETARRIAMAASKADASDDSPAVQLLSDIREVFRERNNQRIASSELAAALAGMEHRPWAEWKGKPITAAAVARLLKPFGIEPHGVRIGDQTPKGYHAAQFQDAFARYLPPESATVQQTRDFNGLCDIRSATSLDRVAHSNDEYANEINDVADVALSPGVLGDKSEHSAIRRLTL
jgi:putative DNA primase/helicase